MMLGQTGLPKGIDGSFHQKVSMSFKLGHGPVDLHLGKRPSAEAFTAAEKLARPGWRQREHASAPRPATAVAVEDLIPDNLRQPRTAPAWLKHEKQVLRFYGFFQESVVERPDENSRYRYVNFMYYMEDGTLSMTEPKVENSGISQGAFLKRHRATRPDGQGFIGPDDFRCGQLVELYGRTYHVTGCDRFTRWFYKENGLDIGEDEPMVEDQWQKSYKHGKLAEKGGLAVTTSAHEAKTLVKYMVGQPPADKKFQQFLLNDRKVLRFKAFWDDPTLYGARIYFTIHYFLSDNTVEINEEHVRNSGRWTSPVFYKRGPLNKSNQLNAYPGMLQAEGNVYMPDDFMVGDSINVWGRKIVVYDCDDFTRKFYKDFSGIDQAESRIDVSEQNIRHLKLHPPPHNGIGSEEDSLINCQMIAPKPHRPDVAKLMRLAGESLRFEATMANGEAEDDCRRFLVSFFPDTDRVGVHELQSRNSGHMAGKFREKTKIKNPATGKWFQMTDFYVGANVNICSQPFHLIRADEHALKFLEACPAEFPYADPAACARKLRPLAGEPEMQDEAGLSPERLRELADSKHVQLVDHEVITLLRRFGTDTEEGPVINGLSLLQAC